MIGMAQRHKDVVRESHEQHNASQMTRNTNHQVSAHSLVGSSGEYHPPSRNQLQVQGATATSAKLEESTAALGRAPGRLEGLTEFLRKEYYRRMGIYLNGGRKEEGILFNFWKEHVSEAYKNLTGKKKQEQKLMNTMKQ